VAQQLHRKRSVIDFIGFLGPYLRQGVGGAQGGGGRVAQQLHRKVAHPLRPVFFGRPLAGLPRPPQRRLIHPQRIHAGRCKKGGEKEDECRFRNVCFMVTGLPGLPQRHLLGAAHMQTKW
jgi:hypothetical protein